MHMHMQAAHPTACNPVCVCSALRAVKKVLETAEPLTKAGLATFYKMHDAFVASKVYKSVVDGTSCTLSWAEGTTTYKLAAQYLYPRIAPVANPALDNLAKNEYVNKMVSYWRPCAPVPVAVA